LVGNRVPVTSDGARSLDDILTNSVRKDADVDAIATRNGTQIQILVWNYHDDLVPAAASPVHLSIKLPSDFGMSATVTRLLADEMHGDAYTVWTSQGKPAAPSQMQIQQLKDSMQPGLVESGKRVDVTSGTVNLDFDLARFGVSLITLTPSGASDASVDDATMSSSVEGGATEASGPMSPVTDGKGGGPVGASSSDAAPSVGQDATPSSSDAGGCSCRLRPASRPFQSTGIFVAMLALLRRGLRRRATSEAKS
jgi:hypothetical protein